MLKEIHHGRLMMLVFFFFPVLFKIRMAYFGSFKYMICGIHGLINVKIVLKWSYWCNSSIKPHFCISFNFFIYKFVGRWTKTFTGRFEVLILSFKILFSSLSALFISSAKSEYNGKGMFSSFIQYKWSSDAKGVADQI